MLAKSGIRPFSIFKYLALSVGILLSGGEIAASGAVRADYDKNDYVLVVGDIIKTDESHSNRAVREINDGIPPSMSGSPGNASVMIKAGMNKFLPNPENYYAITGIGLEERWNKPCVLTLFGTLVDPRYQSKTRLVARHELKKCKGSPLVDFKGFDFSGDITNFDFSKSGKKFLRAIRVCGGSGKVLPQQAFNSLAWKIKGVQAYPSEVKLADSPVLDSEINALDAPGEMEDFIRTNCPVHLQADTGVNNPGWGKWIQCPVDQVVTGVRAYYFEDKYFTGFEISCQSVSKHKVTHTPLKDYIGY